MAKHEDGISLVKSKRTNKHLIERKRRARINNCLLELKSLVLKSDLPEHTRNSKLEKADILEMTVDHIKSYQKLNQGESTPDVSETNSKSSIYRAGYSQCVSDVQRYFETVDHRPDIKENLLCHLNKNKTESLITPISFGRNIDSKGYFGFDKSSTGPSHVCRQEHSKAKFAPQNNTEVIELCFKNCNSMCIIISADEQASFNVNPNVYPETSTNQQCLFCSDGRVRLEFTPHKNNNDESHDDAVPTNEKQATLDVTQHVSNYREAHQCWRPWYEK